MTDIVLASTKTLRTLADGGMTVTLDIAPEHFEAAFRLFGKAGTTVGVAAITPEASRKATQLVMAAEVKEPSLERVSDVLIDRPTFLQKSRAQQAGIRCNQPGFWVFLTEKFPLLPEPVVDAATAADVVRWHCMVDSRRELDAPQGGKGVLWDRLEAEYYAKQHGMR